jgi:hypothetical protein
MGVTGRLGAVLGLLVSLCLMAFNDRASPQTRYFRMCPANGCGSPDDFVIAVTDAHQLQIAQAILDGKVTDQVHVSGRIVRTPAPYNSPWHFHLDPASIQLVTFSHPTCLGHSTSEVDANLNKVGTPAFLPTGDWCPRGFRLTGEVAAHGPAPAYFAVSDGKPSDAFVIALTDPARIKQARAIASGTERLTIHVSGTVVKGAQPYNPGWHFALAPASITFFQVAIEVCDATTSYVDANLDKVGGAFLPGAHWCPWSSKVIRELPTPTK